jgi:omega-hydroxy-beta-dihydromenaquinone-9 sulfotransferase
MPARRHRTTDRSPPLWFGCDAFAWAKLLARHHFAVHRSRWPVAALVSAVSLGHTALRFAQAAAYGRRIARTPIPHAPVFVLGHWRTGTTLLHELLARDPRHAFPTTYDCFVPGHFLLTRSRLPRWLMPIRRPMDAVAAGWDRPQEDEFALCLLGQPSPYERIAFPNRPAAGAGALDLRGLSPAARRRWKTTFYRLVQALTLANAGRRLVLKSPPHTARIPVLLELFPDARFVHIVRDPYDVYPSTLNLWRFLYGAHGLQKPAWEQLPEFILDTFVRMNLRFEEGKRLIPPGRLHELRYEELVRDPVGQVEAIYRALGLGDFAPARPHVEAYLAGVKGYEANRHVLTPAERRAVSERWGDIIRRSGYAARGDSP